MSLYVQVRDSLPVLRDALQLYDRIVNNHLIIHYYCKNASIGVTAFMK